jgi:hypothetical protein
VQQRLVTAVPIGLHRHRGLRVYGWMPGTALFRCWAESSISMRPGGKRGESVTLAVRMPRPQYRRGTEALGLLTLGLRVLGWPLEWAIAVTTHRASVADALIGRPPVKASSQRPRIKRSDRFGHGSELSENHAPSRAIHHRVTRRKFTSTAVSRGPLSQPCRAPAGRPSPWHRICCRRRRDDEVGCSEITSSLSQPLAALWPSPMCRAGRPSDA